MVGSTSDPPPPHSDLSQIVPRTKNANIHMYLAQVDQGADEQPGGEEDEDDEGGGDDDDEEGGDEGTQGTAADEEEEPEPE